MNSALGKRVADHRIRSVASAGLTPRRVHSVAWARSRIVRIIADERFQLGILLVVALLLRLAFHFRSPAFVGKDSQSYFLPGWEIARGQPFEMGQRRTPGYPLFIAGAILALGEELRSLALAQHLLGVATVAVTYGIGRFTFGRATGLVGGLLVAINGPLLLYERYVLSETLAAFMLALTLLAAIIAVRATLKSRDPGRSPMPPRFRAPTLSLWLATGLALGMAVLTRPVAQALIPLLGLAALAVAGRDWRRGLAGAIALAVGLAAVQGPWVMRNALVTGNPSASTFGRTLIARTATYDDGFVFDVPDQPDPDPRMQQAREIVQDGAKKHQSDGEIAGRLRAELDLDPVQVNSVMRDIAVSAIMRNPEHYLSGTVEFTRAIFVGEEERLRDHWEEFKDANPWDERIRLLVGGPTRAEEAERPNANRLVTFYQPHRHAPLLAALFGLGSLLALLVPSFRPALLCSATVGVMLLLSAALNGPVERYRYPLDPLVSVVVAGGACGIPALLAGAARERGWRVDAASDHGSRVTLSESGIASPRGRKSIRVYSRRRPGGAGERPGVHCFAVGRPVGMGPAPRRPHRSRDHPARRARRAAGLRHARADAPPR
jgi:hypothetical protein